MDIPESLKLAYSESLGRLGIFLKDGIVYIRNGSEEIRKMIDRGHGYAKQLHRHKNCVYKDKAIWWAGKNYKCTGIKDLFLTEKEFEQDEEMMRVF